MRGVAAVSQPSPSGPSCRVCAAARFLCQEPTPAALPGGCLQAAVPGNVCAPRVAAAGWPREQVAESRCRSCGSHPQDTCLKLSLHVASWRPPPPPRFRSLSPGGTPLRSHFHTNSHLRACFWEAAEKSCLPAKWGGRGAEKSRPPEDTGSRDHPGAPTPQHGCQGNPTRPERQKGPLLEVSGGWRWWKARRLEVLAAGSEP